MTSTEAPAAAPKKPKRKRKPRNSSQPASKPTDELAGLTVQNCYAACNADRCVISGSNYCAHPRKGGLQGQQMHDQAAIGRLQKALKMLAQVDADKRFG